MKNKAHALFIHGAGGSSQHWHPLLGYLNSSISPILFEIPGHGQRSGTVPASMNEALSDLEIFVARKNLKEFNLIGHSLGGILSLLFVLKHHERVNKLILISSATKILIHPYFIYQIKNKKIDSSFIEAGLADSISQDRKRIIMDGLRNTRLSDNDNDFMDIGEYSLKKDIRKIANKTLIIIGEHDKIVSPRRSKNLGQDICGSITKIIPGAKHHPHLEKTKETADYINDFILWGC